MSALSKPESISIFEYTDFRLFLRDHYLHKKKTQIGYSFRVFSRLAGLKSPNFLKLVIENKRNLSDEGIACFAKALKLSDREKNHFRNLVYLNQSKSVDQKKYFAELIMASGSKGAKRLSRLKKAQYEYYARWYNVAIRELVATEGFVDDPEWIAKRIVPSITVAQARHALQNLKWLGFIQKDQNQKWVQAEAQVFTGDEITSALVSRYHQEMIKMGSESLERFSHEQREISSLSFGISQSGMNNVKSMIQKFLKELLEVVCADQELTQVYQLNFQLFPLTASPTHSPETEAKREK